VQYSYKCKEKICGEIFIAEHGMNENPKVKCPACGKQANKHISKTPPGVIWKAKKSTAGGRS